MRARWSSRERATGRRASWSTSVAAAQVVALYVFVRLMAALALNPGTYSDTADYKFRGWETRRPYGISALFSIFGTSFLLIFVQVVAASLLWCWMFGELVVRFRDATDRTTRLALAGSFAVCVVLSLSRPILMWDHIALSECLSFGLLAAGVAAMSRLIRRPDGVSLAIGVAVLMAMALTRETVLLGWGIPLAILCALTLRLGVFVRLAMVALPLLLVPIATHPGTAKYVRPGITISNYRAMNVIGVRILPNDYLRNRLASSGLPDVDASLRGAFSFSQNYRLYQSRPLVKFANNFPTARYVMAELSRPFSFYRYALPALDREVPRSLGPYGAEGAELVPASLAGLVWNWSGAAHLALLASLGVSVLAGRRPGSHGLRSLRTGAFLFALVGSMSGVAARVLDTMEQARHTLPFFAVSRMALTVGVVTMLLNANEIIRARKAAQTDQSLVWVSRPPKQPPFDYRLVAAE